MKLSLDWLQEWIKPYGTAEQIADHFTAAGLEVESITPVAPAWEKVIVGQILLAEKHPNADRLKVCKVDIGQTTPLSIVCGGKNARQGLRVAVAVEGSELPGGIHIKKTTLRDVPSEGMLCSAKELGLAQESEGILELPSDAPIGKSVRDYLQLDDTMLDVALTPNRADCASVRGLARDLSVMQSIPFRDFTVTRAPVKIKDIFPVQLNAATACPRYVSRVIRGIRTDALTPVIIQERLRRNGTRSIHPVVDITNYVMLELGQPLHAFDLQTLTQSMDIRFARNGETIELLDDQTLTLTSEDLVVADQQGLQALAGVMGGKKSGISNATTDILLESAFFTPSIIIATAKRYRLSSDSSYRFERGVDYALQVAAIERATEWILKICGGKAGPVVEKNSKEQLPKSPIISLRREQIVRILGIEIPDKQVSAIFKALQLNVKSTRWGWQVTVPSFRFDLVQEVDLIEELARIYGYDKIPAVKLLGTLTPTVDHESVLSPIIFSDMLVNRGYQEAINYSFISKELAQQIDPQSPTVSLKNPLSADMSVMRTSLWPGLLQAAAYNQNRQADRVRLFECGRCFYPKGHDWDQPLRLAGLALGSCYPLQWGETERVVDYFDVKSDVEALLSLAGHIKKMDWKRAEHSALHPGQSASIVVDGKHTVGWLGALHPRLVSVFGFTHAPILFELSMDYLNEAPIPHFESIPKFPSVRRDLALIVDQNLPSSEIGQKIREFAGHLLIKVEIFDIYQGEGIEKGKKSIALGLTFQAPTRTLVDEDIHSLVDRVMLGLQQTFDAKLRT